MRVIGIKAGRLGEDASSKGVAGAVVSLDGTPMCFFIKEKYSLLIEARAADEGPVYLRVVLTTPDGKELVY